VKDPLVLNSISYLPIVLNQWTFGLQLIFWTQLVFPPEDYRFDEVVGGAELGLHQLSRPMTSNLYSKLSVVTAFVVVASIGPIYIDNSRTGFLFRIIFLIIMVVTIFLSGALVEYFGNGMLILISMWLMRRTITNVQAVAEESSTVCIYYFQFVKNLNYLCSFSRILSLAWFPR